MRYILELLKWFSRQTAQAIVSVTKTIEQQEIARVQAKGIEVTRERERIDALYALIDERELVYNGKVDAYTEAHIASRQPINEVRADAERYAAIL